jgi:uncharacterized membrane protein (Fun14 family)
MVVDTLTTSLISSVGFPLAGGGLLGVATGYAIKKIMKLAFIGLGLLALLLGFLEYKHWISVNWITVESQTSSMMTHAANKIMTVTQHMNQQIPIGLGVVAFIPGLAIGFMKG